MRIIQINVAMMILSAMAVSDSSFVISEIFGGFTDRKLAASHHWIELANLTAGEIKVSSIVLEIFDVVSETAVFSQSIAPNVPAQFADYLVIAQSKSLGLTTCLKDNLTIIAMPTLKVDEVAGKKFCVTINDNEKSCATVSGKIKMTKGTSIFRELKDGNDTPLWRYEPCHLIDETFASPGKEARFCTKMMSELFFKRCDNVKELKISKWQPGASLSLVFDYEIRIASLCASHQSNRICHMVDSEKPVYDREPPVFSLASWRPAMGNIFYVRDEDLFGNGVIKTISQIAPNTVNNIVALIFNVNTANKSVEITLDLKDEDVPINVSIEDSCGQNIIFTKSFVEPGQKSLQLIHKPPCPQVSINLIGVTGNFRTTKLL